MVLPGRWLAGARFEVVVDTKWTLEPRLLKPPSVGSRQRTLGAQVSPTSTELPSPEARAQRVPTAHDLGPAHIRAPEAAGRVAAAARDGDPAAGEAAGGDQRLGPRTPGRPGNCSPLWEDETLSEAASSSTSHWGWGEGRAVAAGEVAWVRVVPTVYIVSTHFSLLLSGCLKDCDSTEVKHSD